MNRRFRIIAALAVLAGMLLPQTAVIAYNAGQISTLGQIGNAATQANQVANQVQGYFTQYTGLNLGDVLEESGLQGAKAKLCQAQNILGQVENITDNWKDILTAEIGRAVNEAVQAVIKQLAICALHAIPYIGAAFPECNIKAAGNDIEQNLRNQALQFKQRFIGGCVAAAQLNDMMALALQITNTWGPDGQQVYVTNWVSDIFTEPDRRALRRMWTLLVNTDICPHFRTSILDYFGVPLLYRESPPPISSTELAVNADTPFPQRARCTMPEDFDPASLTTPEGLAAAGGFGVYEKMKEPQNNFEGFARLARAELNEQRATTVQAAIAEATSGGGFRSIYGNAAQSCRIRDAAGECIEFTEAKQPPANAAVIGALPIEIPVEAALRQAPGPEDPPINDMLAIFANHTMGMLNQPLPFTISFGFLNDKDNVFTPVPTPTPDPNDAACAGGDPRCECVANDQTFQQAVQSAVDPAMQRLQQTRPNLFDPPGSGQLASGVTLNELRVALCENLAESPGQCKPSPLVDDAIVLLAGGRTIEVKVLNLPGRTLVQGGGLAVRACDPGVVD